MILFADTSALIKLYVDETGSGAMTDRAEGARLALSALAYAEVHATFARRRRETLLTDAEHSVVATEFERDCQAVIVVPLRPALLGQVPRLVRQHPLRGADAVHLASALALRTAGIDVTFAAADGRLAAAALAEGLEVFDPVTA